MKKFILILMTIIFLSLLVYSSIHIFSWFKDNKHTDEVTNEILNYAQIEEKDNIKTTEGKVGELIVDFDSLKEKNQDTKGWIEVKGTNINYPFVQAKDNDYYLKHSFDKKYTDAGWVFMDYRNNIDILDKNTIIYAHARKDKTMFGTLKYTLKKNWYSNSENQIIKIITENEELLFQTFSTYHIKTENYYITTNFSNDEEYEKFLNTLKNRSTHNFNVNLSKNDYILTLSSCFTNEEKVVLHAKLISREAKTQE